jgi:predicted kinase
MASKVIIMRGVSTSGKDTFISSTLDIHTADVLSSDFYRQHLFGDDKFQRGNDKVFDLLYSVLDTRLANHCGLTILNSMNLAISDCKPALEIIKKHSAECLVISLSVPTDELMKRHEDRRVNGGIYIPPTALLKKIERYNNCTRDFTNYATDNSDWFTFMEINFDE